MRPITDIQNNFDELLSFDRLKNIQRRMQKEIGFNCEINIHITESHIQFDVRSINPATNKTVSCSHSTAKHALNSPAGLNNTVDRAIQYMIRRLDLRLHNFYRNSPNSPLKERAHAKISPNNFQSDYRRAIRAKF